MESEVLLSMARKLPCRLRLEPGGRQEVLKPNLDPLDPVRVYGSTWCAASISSNAPSQHQPSLRSRRSEPVFLTLSVGLCRGWDSPLPAAMAPATGTPCASSASVPLGPSSLSHYRSTAAAATRRPSLSPGNGSSGRARYSRDKAPSSGKPTSWTASKKAETSRNPAPMTITSLSG